MRALAVVLALSVAAIALAGCLRTGVSVGQPGRRQRPRGRPHQPPVVPVWSGRGYTIWTPPESSAPALARFLWREQYRI